MKKACFLFFTSMLFGSGAAWGQSRFEFWPGAVYDPGVPTAQKVLGYDFGERIASHADIVKYFTALAAAEPARVRIFEYGKTWEGRELIYAVIGSEANLRRLPQIRAAMQKLHDPRKTSAAEAQKLIQDLPSILWLAYGVHGNEISSPDAAMVTAYHLLAARNDKMVADILANTLTIVDPLQNPDGRNRFVHNFEVNLGLEPDANPLAAEHSEAWPGARTNHYSFDLNRDWVGFTQPETIGHVKVLQEWYPQVFIDLHEMGTDATYYFTPEADPYNPFLTKEQHDDLYWFGKNNAKYFDLFGFRYFTREEYDAFYPGYGASWPFYLGGLAMTYENGSTRGLVVRRGDDTTITFRETVRRHFVTSVASCEVAANNRQKLLDMFYRYQATALKQAEAGGSTREYILPRRGDTSAVDKLVQLLVLQGVEVDRPVAPFSADGKGYPAGSYIVPLAQPEARLVEDLLAPQVSMDDKFLTEEERRRKLRQRSEIYDVTAWSVPLQFNVECIASNTRTEGRVELVKLGAAPAGYVEGKASVAYLVPWGTAASARLLAGALRAGLRVFSTDKKFTQNGRVYPDGTLIVMVKDNPPNLLETLRKLATGTGAEVVATDTSWVDDGPNFGSERVVYMKPPAIAIAWDRPTNATSAGETRFVLERQFGYPTTVVRTQQLATADLSRFQVIILPEAGGEGYGDVLGGGAARRLHDWVQGGGTLIGIGSAVSYLGGNGFLAISRENAPAPAAPANAGAGRGGRGGVAAGGEASTQAEGRGGAGAVPGQLFATENDMEKATQPDTQAPWPAHGFLARAKVNPDHWITAGVPETVYTLVSGSGIYTPLKVNQGVNAAYFAAADQVMASGYSWEEFRKQLAFKPLVVVQRSGRGNVIGFTANPNYRATLDGMNLLFLNAIFRGTAHAGGGGRGGREER